MDIKIIASGSSGNAYLIGDGKTRLLLDAGIPFKRIQVGCGFQTSSIDGCLVTHRHGDHAMAIPKLLQRGITVYSNADVAGLYPGVEQLDALKEHKIGTFRILPFEAEHDVPCYGYQATSVETGEKLVYITDSAYVSIETLLDLLQANDMSKVRQIYLLHLSDGNSDAEAFKRQVQQETGAEVYIA